MEINDGNALKYLLIILRFLNLIPISGFGSVEFRFQNGKIVHTHKGEDIKF
jgi:hypothetical protein